MPKTFWPKVLKAAAAAVSTIAGALPAAGHLGREAPGPAIERRLAPEVLLVGELALELRGLGRLALPTRVLAGWQLSEVYCSQAAKFASVAAGIIGFQDHAGYGPGARELLGQADLGHPLRWRSRGC